jgi:hypothetical protein
LYLAGAAPVRVPHSVGAVTAPAVAVAPRRSPIPANTSAAAARGMKPPLVVPPRMYASLGAVHARSRGLDSSAARVTLTYGIGAGGHVRHVHAASRVLSGARSQ